MISKIIACTFFRCLLQFESAALNTTASGTSRRKISPKEAAFLQQHGTDDVSKAIIR